MGDGRMRVGALGIGVQKCMTSWIHAVAGAHPQIHASNPKEIDFFSYYFDRGHRWYDRHFAGRLAGQTCFECSPSYFYDPRAPERVARYNPDMRLIVVLRDPVERAYSNHLHEVVKGHIPAVPFSQGLANNPTYVEQGRYAKHLSRWLDWFPRDRLMVLMSEDIVGDVGAAARQVYSYLGVDPSLESGVLTEKRNDSDRAKFAVLRSVLRTGGDGLRRAGLEEFLIKAKKTEPFRSLLRFNSVPVRGDIPPLSEDERAHLREVFAPEVERVMSLLKLQSLPWAHWPHASAQQMSA